MTSQSPQGGSPSRRRRIAGERKGAVARPDTGTDPTEARPERPGPPAAAPAVAAAGPGDEPTPAATADSPTTDATGDATDGDERGQSDARPVSTRVLAALAVAAVLLVAFAASGFGLDGVGVQAWRSVAEHSEVESAQRGAPAAAERAAAAILSYSHESLETDRDTAARFMTSDYRKKYLDTFGLVLENAPEVEAVVEAEIKASGVAHADADRVNVLLFVNQTTTSTANQGEPQLALNRVMMTMEQQDGTWLVDDITSY